MIKLIIYITKLILVTITALLFASCNFGGNSNSIEGSGNVTTQNRTVTAKFTKIEVQNAIDLVIEQSDSSSIVVEADDNLIDKITTKIENGTLVIECDFNSFRNSITKKVTVKMPVIHEIESSSAATVRSTSILKSTHLKLDASSASEMNISVESDKVSVSTSSGSTINVEGMALEVEADASSGSVINAQNLEANDVNADASSGASISVHPIASLKAEASSGAGISYSKIPKTMEKKSNSGGSITQK